MSDTKITTLEGLWFTGHVQGFGLSCGSMTGCIESKIGEDAWLAKLKNGNRAVLPTHAMVNLRFFENQESMGQYIEKQKERAKKSQELQKKLMEAQGREATAYPFGVNASMGGNGADDEED